MAKNGGSKGFKKKKDPPKHNGIFGKYIVLRSQAILEVDDDSEHRLKGMVFG